MTKPIPEGLLSVTPHLCIRDCEKALAFYEKAFGAEIVSRSPGPGGKIMHAHVKVGDSTLFMADEFPEMGGTHALKSPTALGGTTIMLNFYCPDADAMYARAVKAGATSIMPPTNMFWGDRYSQVVDPFGHSWAIATRLENLTPEEQAERSKKWQAEMAAQKQPK